MQSKALMYAQLTRPNLGKGLEQAIPARLNEQNKLQNMTPILLTWRECDPPAVQRKLKVIVENEIFRMLTTEIRWVQAGKRQGTS